MLEIVQTKVFRGPSLWAHAPVIRLTVDAADLAGRPTNTIPGFVERLVAIVPSLSAHRRSSESDDLIGRMERGLPMSHVLSCLALEFQRLAGSDLAGGQPDRPAEGQSGAIYAYEHERVGVAAGLLAVRLVNHIIYGVEPALDFQQFLQDEIARPAEKAGFGPSTQALVEEARRRGISVYRPDPKQSLVILGQGKKQRRIWATATDGTSLVGSYAARDKGVSAHLLQDAFIPTPASIVVLNAEAAADAAAQLGYPVVVKPVDGNHGRGVGLSLNDDVAVRSAFASAASESRGDGVVVQHHISGQDYRVLVVGGDVVAVAERVPAHVVCDGASTVRELVDRENRDPKRGEEHSRTLTLIAADDAATALLDEQGLSWNAVPESGRVVQLASTANLSTGGISIDRTDDIHPVNAELAREAALVVGLDVAGIDIVTANIARPMAEDGGAIVEVNAAPGFRMHTHPSEGEARPVAQHVMEMLFPLDQCGRIPIVAITGTNGKTTTTRMAAHLLRSAGQSVGMTTTDGVYIGERLVAAGDMAGPASARAVLRHPAVDAAVLETARGGILREGLGFDHCDVAIVTNIAADHLGLGGIETLEDMARVKAVVPASVRANGASILNADDPLVVGMARSAGGEVVFFGGDEKSPVLRNHRLVGGRIAVLALTLSGDMLRLVDESGEHDVLLASDIPATFGGMLRVNALNALAAAAAAWVRDVPISTIRNGLRTFHADFATTPGRFNLLNVEGRHVLVDYAHNVAALEAVGDFVRRFGAPRSVAMLAIPGDRSDEDTVALGHVGGGIFDALVIREAANTRGRPRGESAGLLRDAALAAGVPDRQIRVVLDEVDAAHATVDLADSGDLAVIFVTRPKVIWEELTGRAARLSPGQSAFGAD